MADDESPQGSGGLLKVAPAEPTLRVAQKVDLETIREETRSYIAKGLVLLLVAVAIALIGLTAWGKLSIDDAKDLAGAVLSPLIAVTGTALGFYFGGHHGSN